MRWSRDRAIFFNTEWTPGQAEAPSNDDFPAEAEDPLCSSGSPARLTPQNQQRAGATYVAAAARVFVERDDRVLPLLDGSGVSAPSVAPARVLTHALGAARTPAVIPDETLTIGGSGGRLCEQVDPDPGDYCLPPVEFGTPSPHFVAFGDVPDEPGRYAVELAWSAPGQGTILRPARPATVAGHLALRIVVPAGTTGTRLGVVATDAQGRTADLGEVRLDGLPGTDLVPSGWGQEVRVPLKGLTSLAELELIPRSAGGSAWLIDAWGQQPGLPAIVPGVLPRLDVGEVTVAEGDSGTRPLDLPIRYAGSSDGTAQVFLVDAETGEVSSFVATVRPGQTAIRTPVEITGDTLFGYDRFYVAGVKAIRGLVIGDYLGEAVITDEDPAPAVTVAAVTDSVAEGGTLRWRVTMAGPAESPVWISALASPARPELSTLDVDPDWLWEVAFDVPEPERPLSSVPVEPYLEIPPGALTADVIVPTIADDVTEPAERVILRVQASGRGQPRPIGTITGTVPASG